MNSALEAAQRANPLARVLEVPVELVAVVATKEVYHQDQVVVAIHHPSVPEGSVTEVVDLPEADA